MDFTFSEEQDAVRDLSEQIFAGHATPERVKAVEGNEGAFDRALWLDLAAANLLGLALPEDVGGSDLGVLEACVVLEAQGRHVAPVPLWPAVMLGALAVNEFGSAAQRMRWLPSVVAGDTVLTAALETGTPVRAERATGGWRLTGDCPTVPSAPVATRIAVPAVAGSGEVVVALVDPAATGVGLTPVVTTNRQHHGHVHLAEVEVADGDVLGDPASGAAIVEWTRQRAVAGLCALQIGVCEAAVRLAAEYTSHRSQFGKPLSTFQGAALKAADAYIDTEAMRVTLWQAAWRLHEGLDATAEVAVAKWWAAEGGHRVVHAAQHLHGGIGSDVDYPVHRYFLWGKQIEDMLGGAGAHLAALGRLIAEGARA